jgi:hypothetical protein
VFDASTEDIGDGLDSAMRMPREAFDVIPWIIGTKIVKKQEWIERRYLLESKCSLQVDAGSFDGGFALDDLPDLSILLHFVPPQEFGWCLSYSLGSGVPCPKHDLDLFKHSYLLDQQSNASR